MKVHQVLWLKNQSCPILPTSNDVNLVLAFGSCERLALNESYETLRSFYPNAEILLCSTAGEIFETQVYDDSIAVTAITFQNTDLRIAERSIKHSSDSYTLGKQLSNELMDENLRHIFVLSDGQHINGSDLVNGLSSLLPSNVSITGGLAGDAANFSRTLVGRNAVPESGKVIAVGLYGDSIRIGYGSRGGWDSFGPERIVTRSEGNVLYELDRRSALDLYKEYLGDRANDLPGSALLFPLSIKLNGHDPIVRTILSIDDESKSMTFAGDIPHGAKARLMKANFDRLVDGASHAATNSIDSLQSDEPELAILISCVGRKLVLGERIDEEVETIRDVIGPKAAICGFYSYGEISPLTPTTRCELHNQTMTITTLREV